MKILIVNAAIIAILFLLVLLFISSEHFRKLIIKFWQFALGVSGGGYNRLKGTAKWVCVKTRFVKIVTANRLTYLRFAIVTTFFVMILYSLWQHYFWVKYLKYVIALDIVAYTTDLFDGAIAELQETVSDRGSWLDNTADKLLCLGNLYFLVSLCQTWSLALWIAFFEISSAAFRFYAHKRGLNLHANKLGKVKLFFQGFGFCFVVSTIPQLTDPGKIILIISVFFAGGSLITHFVQNYKILSGMQNGL